MAGTLTQITDTNFDAEVLEADPPALVAVTTTRTVLPRSLAPSA